MNLSKSIQDNKAQLKEYIPVGTSFDLVLKDLVFGSTKAFWIGVNGMINSGILQKMFSDLQNPIYTQNSTVDDINQYLTSKIGYIQTQLSSDWDTILRNIVSGPSALFIDGFETAIIIDVRSYPTRGIDEPDTEKVTRGARDGFVETMLFNCNLIRRRIRDYQLTFEMNTVGTSSKTDVAIAYVGNLVDNELLDKLKEKIKSLPVTSLTLGSKSLEELLVKKRWYNPLPSIQMTERPDVACSYLMEGHILVIVDNSPSVIILPCTIFQFTQSPEDYYKSPAVGNYFRIVRFVCIFGSLFIMPIFLLIGANYPEFSQKINLISTQDISPYQLFVYVLIIEIGLDLFKYSSSLSSSGFSSSLSIVGGLIVGDVAIQLNWASIEVIFYAAVTLLTTLSLPSIEFGEGLRLYRIFLIVLTGLGGKIGFCVGVTCILISIISTPTFASKSYFWPLKPFNWEALKVLLLRYPTAKAQPSKAWKRKRGSK